MTPMTQQLFTNDADRHAGRGTFWRGGLARAQSGALHTMAALACLP